MFNQFGAVTLQRGEIAIAVPGSAPSKQVLIDFKDRPLLLLEVDLQWLELLSVTGRDFRALQRRNESIKNFESAPTDVLVEWAEVTYDLRRFDTVQILTELARGRSDVTAFQRSRLDLLESLMEVRNRDIDYAHALLERAMNSLEDHRLVVGRLAQMGLAIEREDYELAASVLTGLDSEKIARADVVLYQAWFRSFLGEHVESIRDARRAQRRFPDEARFPVLLSFLYLVAAEKENMRRAIDEALAIDPDQLLGWHAKAIYHQYVAPDAERTEAAYLRVLEIGPGFTAGANGLAILYADLGSLRKSLEMMERAFALEPNRDLVKANYGALLTSLNRLDDAQVQFDELLASNPGSAWGLLGQGFLDLALGRTESGVENILKAMVANPDIPGIDAALGMAFYQAHRFDAAVESLGDSRRRDPDNPVGLIIGSFMAVDQAEAGEAIRLAREGLEKTLRSETYARELLASNSGGSTALGNAYANLGLNEWGGFYEQLSFSPYLPNGYFFLSQANQFDSERARLGASEQGLLLEPTALSFRTRYYEPFQRPFQDVSVFGSIGKVEGESTYFGSGTVQGLGVRTVLRPRR